MQRQSGIDTVLSNGYLTAQVMQRQACQQDALSRAEQKRALRAAGLTNEREPRASRRHRVCAALGSALIGIAVRLHGASAPATRSAH